MSKHLYRKIDVFRYFYLMIDEQIISKEYLTIFTSRCGELLRAYYSNNADDYYRNRYSLEN